MISLIAARARNGAIGRDNDIPWHAPEDLAFFKRETLGGAVIMGRKTWESLPFKPLKNRLNLVVTSRDDLDVACFSSVDEAIVAAHSQGYQRIYGIGGAGIYGALLPKAHRLLITEVDLEIANADAFFPELDETEWECISTFELRDDEPACVMRELLRLNL